MPEDAEHPDWRIKSFYEQALPGQVIVSEAEIDLNRGRRLIFVYCNLAEDTLVGGIRLPLLRSTLISGQYGELSKEVFAIPIYIGLRTNSFDMIEIEFRSENGSLIPFNSGVSLVTIHFKQVPE